LAANKGLQKLRRAAYHARAASVASSARSRGRNALDVQMLDLKRMIGAAVAIEAVARFDGVFMPQKPKLNPRQFVRQMQFRRRLRVIQGPKQATAG
jgi:hypothetical protein